MEATMKLIFDDDNEAVDFLADLKDRTPIFTMQRLLNEMGLDTSMCHVFSHPTEKLISVVILNAPIIVDETKAHIFICAHPDIDKIIQFFTNWIHETPYKDRQMRIALREVLEVLYVHKNTNKNKPAHVQWV